jgi:hypothetical protein
LFVVLKTWKKSEVEKIMGIEKHVNNILFPSLCDKNPFYVVVDFIQYIMPINTCMELSFQEHVWKYQISYFFYLTKKQTSSCGMFSSKHP